MTKTTVFEKLTVIKTETFDMLWDYYDLSANNSLVFIDNNDSININDNNDFKATLTNYSTFDDNVDINDNNDFKATLTNYSTFDDNLDETLIWESINLEINDVSGVDSNADANIHTEHKLVTDDVSSFGKTLPACT
ncbi:hypothetical protein HELRODRAFT_176165 [Helobdella robusta]|uniref:Uncharacterized protein n=1 Tax=Helobdella robusta TaxID=6412 RepID=T1FA87_HELRO|nr:hypothetical protein HELRODRAFT_176165 [Helobdella robusta]ESO00300.1 hypothetical protein HELRODRAFT_176165 [Helobdella robusta]